jgi:predicted aspartyl protease
MRRLIVAGIAVASFIAAGGLTMAHGGSHDPPPPVVSFAAASPEIPFELFRGNRLVVTANINGRDTPVMLDSGASATTLDRAFARSIGLPEGVKIEGHGVGGTVEAELISGVTLKVGGLRFDQMNVGAMDLSEISRSIGRPINVVLGRELFNSAVISIDWVRNRLRLSSPTAFRPPAGAVRLDLLRNGPFNTIPVSVDGAEPIQALFDVGAGGALSLPVTYWRAHPDLAQLRFAEVQGGGVGGPHSARAVTVPKVILAGRTFNAVPAQLSNIGNDSDPTQMANVGIGFLKQFHVDLDLGQNRIYLAPRNDSPPFDRDRGGVRLDFASGVLKVAFVSPQGPAAAAGLKVGDQIVAVDGQRVDSSYYERPDWTRLAAGRLVSLERADGTRVGVTLRDYY